MRRQLAQLPLHTGAAPAWLFGRMWKLAGAITHQIMQRREHLESLRDIAPEEVEMTLMSRIRSYFGL